MLHEEYKKSEFLVMRLMFKQVAQQYIKSM